MFSPSPDKKNVSTTPTKTLKQLCRDRQLSTAGIVERAELEQLVLSSVAHWGAIPAAAEPEPDAAVEPEPEPVAEEDPAAAGTLSIGSRDTWSASHVLRLLGLIRPQGRQHQPGGGAPQPMMLGNAAQPVTLTRTPMLAFRGADTESDADGDGAGGAGLGSSHGFFVV